MPETSVTHLLLDPSSPVGQRTLYACGFGRGVFKSTDNGKTWALKNAGITEAKPFAWRIVRANDGTLYLLVARNNNGQAGEPGGGAIYRSSDGAEHWQRMTLPPGTNAPNGLALDPRDNRRMYLAAWGQGRADVDTGGGVFLSTDGGGTWKQVLQRSQHVYDVTVNTPQSRYALRLWFRRGRVPLDRRGAALVAHPRLQLQMGPSRDPRSEGSRENLRYDLRRQRLARSGCGRPKAIDDIVDPVPVAF